MIIESTDKFDKLFFDIETIASPDAELYLPEVSAPSNYKDPEKIERYIEEKKKSLIDSAALDPHLGNIIAMGTRLVTDNTLVEENVLIANNEEMEEQLLEKFWEYFSASNKIIGYNIIDFDLPYLLARSMVLNVRTDLSRFDINFYRNEKIVDLMKILFPRSGAKSLKFLAKRYNITGLVSLDIDGSHVSEMSEKELSEYCMSDVVLVEQLYEWMASVYGI